MPLKRTITMFKPLERTLFSASLGLVCLVLTTAVALTALTPTQSHAVELSYTTVLTEPGSGVWKSAIKVDGETYHVNGMNGLTIGVIRNERRAINWVRENLGLEVTQTVLTGGSSIDAGPDKIYGTADDVESGGDRW